MLDLFLFNSADRQNQETYRYTSLTEPMSYTDFLCFLILQLYKLLLFQIEKVELNLEAMNRRNIFSSANKAIMVENRTISSKGQLRRDIVSVLYTIPDSQ